MPVKTWQPLYPHFVFPRISTLTHCWFFLSLRREKWACVHKVEVLALQVENQGAFRLRSGQELSDCCFCVLGG